MEEYRWGIIGGKEDCRRLSIGDREDHRKEYRREGTVYD